MSDAKPTDGRILMHPQPVWEEDPEKTTDGTYVGRYRCAFWSTDGPDEDVCVDEHVPPSPMHLPCTDDGIIWYWTTDRQNKQGQTESSQQGEVKT